MILACRIINAYGTNTRLSGGLMAPEMLAAMAEAARATVEMHHLQAAASRKSAKPPARKLALSPLALPPLCCWGGGLHGAAWCGRDGKPPALARGMPDEFITIRSQRNTYDRALRVGGRAHH
jgi:L-seryl-tRNA(Ser) seleniumtransferase